MAQPANELVFAPLGGVGEIGMNLSIYGLGPENARQWLAVDLGVSFASEEHLPGVDLILPDIPICWRSVKLSPALSSRTLTKTISARSSTSGRS